MASVSSQKPTAAKRSLDFALGEKRVRLDQLSAREFDEFLHKVMEDVDLRELRGFKPLGKFLEQHSNERNPDPLDIANLDLDPAVVLDVLGFDASDEGVDLNTHVLSAKRGLRKLDFTFKRNESGEETGSREVATSWGRSAYIFEMRAETMVLRRPRNHSYSDENLLVVAYETQKVLLEPRHLVKRIKVTRIPTNGFRKFFGADYAREAVGLIWELATIHDRTLSELESQAKRYRDKHTKLRRLSDAISAIN
jgi:hypothetical protein